MIEKMKAAVSALRRGSFVVVTDDDNRENEGDLIIAAEHVTREALAFMLRYTSGVVCVAITDARAQELELPLMVPENNESQRTAFTVSVDFRHGTTTGISAADRSLAIRGLSDPTVGPSSFLRPGHVFPLRARPGGVLERRGHTEAAVDLMEIARLSAAGGLCELTDRDGALLDSIAVREFAREHGFPLLSVGDIANYRRATEFPLEVAARTG
jgi:3,4-dihydroxy-2-butanone 4-phosphate synthase